MWQIFKENLQYPKQDFNNKILPLLKNILRLKVSHEPYYVSSIDMFREKPVRTMKQISPNYDQNILIIAKAERIFISGRPPTDSRLKNGQKRSLDYLKSPKGLKSHEF